MLTIKKNIQVLLYVCFDPLSGQSLPGPTKTQLEWQRMDTIDLVHFRRKIENSPVEQNLKFSQPVIGRYLRFSALSVANN